MATKKTAAAAAAPASKQRALANYEQQFAAAAAQVVKGERPAGVRSISTRGGHLTIDGVTVPDNAFDVVVLAAVHENQYYSRSFNPDTPQTPDCYAFADPDSDDPEGTMRPHPDAPNPQCETCEDCPQNRMGSAMQGRGKACKNVRRLAVILAEDAADEKTLEESEMRMLKVPVMSVRNWADYVRVKLAEGLRRPPWSVSTHVAVVPDPKSQFKIVFSLANLLQFNDPIYNAIQARIKEAEAALRQPYPKLGEDDQPAAAAQKQKPAARSSGRSGGKAAAKGRRF